MLALTAFAANANLEVSIRSIGVRQNIAIPKTS
jgi:hypothetical protein